MDENPNLETIHAIREKVKGLWQLASRDVRIENVDAVAKLYNEIQADINRLLELERVRLCRKSTKPSETSS